MAVNRIQIKASLSDKSVTIPIGQTFEEIGQEELIKTWEEVELQDNINVIQDYETTRYAYKNNAAPVGSGGSNTISYKFHFWDAANQWYTGTGGNPHTFNVVGYLNKDLAKPKKAFTKSFFKFDFYDSPKKEEQKIMFTNIMPLNNCIRITTEVDELEDPIEYYSQIANDIIPPTYGIYVPTAILSPLKGKNENFYIQWLKDRELTPIDTFYMSCKFFNAKTGKVTNMINDNPTPSQINNGLVLNNLDWFYYKVKLFIGPSNTSTIIPKYRYVVTKFNEVAMLTNTGGVAGTGLPGGTPADAVPNTPQVPNAVPIKFYEYVNP